MKIITSAMAHDITIAIERVADKRHARLCATMPESSAARHIAAYLGHLESYWNGHQGIEHHIGNLKAGYQTQLSQIVAP